MSFFNRRLIFYAIIAFAFGLVGLMLIGVLFWQFRFAPPNLEATAAAFSLQATQDAMVVEATQVGLNIAATQTALEAMEADLIATQVALDAPPTATPPPQPTGTSTPESSPSLTPIPTSARDLSTLLDSIDENDITQDGFYLQVADINYEAWPLIYAQNYNNEEPPEGFTMVMITLRATHVKFMRKEFPAIDASDFQLIGDRDTFYAPYRESCGVVPDRLDAVIPLGKMVDGNVCFQVPEDEGEFRLIYEPHGTLATTLLLPERDDPDWEPLPPEPVIIDNTELTLNGLDIDIVDTNYEAWPEIEAENSLNDPPLVGMRMLLITVQVTNEEGTVGEPIELWSSDFQLIGDRNVAYQTFNPSCGVIPNELNSVVDVEGTTTGTVCFQVSYEESGFRLIYEPFGVPAFYSDLPQPE